MSQSPRGLTGWLTCAGPYGTVQRGITGRTFVDDRYKTLFNDTMESLGYDVTGNPGRLFDEEEDMMRTTYSIGARVTDIKADLCHRQTFLFGYDRGEDGEAALTVEWTVFDLLHRKNVFKTTTKGYARLGTANFEGTDVLMEEAFAAAAHNLGADKDFHDLVFFGLAPENTPGTFEDPYENPPSLYDSRESVTLPARPLFTGGLDMGALSPVAVMIQAGNTHGSGFFITREGHILTNAHVVGAASRVRVVTAGKKEKLIAEVLRIDRKRDVALLKLEEWPGDFAMTVLPIRLDKPAVSETVYAVGAPAYKQLQDTVTKGIVSAHRYDRKARQWEIQADVTIHGGSSGGPLLDAHGNIVGLAVSGYVNGAQELSGLNNFIPIADALEALDIPVSKP